MLGGECLDVRVELVQQLLALGTQFGDGVLKAAMTPARISQVYLVGADDPDRADSADHGQQGESVHGGAPVLMLVPDGDAVVRCAAIRWRVIQLCAGGARSTYSGGEHAKGRTKMRVGKEPQKRTTAPRTTYPQVSALFFVSDDRGTK